MDIVCHLHAPSIGANRSAPPMVASGPSRHSRLVRGTVAIGEQQTLSCTSAEWLSSV